MDAGCDSRALMRKIQETDFALLETAIYLDAYPENADALTYYQAQKRVNDALREEYTAAFGPLTVYTNEASDEWKWVRRAWPWEYESN